MSDTEGEGKKGGYRLEYASSARAKCKGPKPCSGTLIVKGELRMGSLVDFRGNTSFAWRHWGCVTPKIITNIKKSFEAADELDGFEDLKPEDQAKIRKAWQDGHVANEDIPESARKSEDDEQEDDEGQDEDEDEDAKPKKKATAKKDAKSTKKAQSSDGPSVFKFEYSSSGRAKCKGCGESIKKDFFRIGQEVDFRGNKSFQYLHWGCLTNEQVEQLKKSYSEASEVEGFGDLKEEEQEKVTRAWEAGEIPEADKGAGEAVDTGKKAPAKKAKKSDDSEPPKKRARKAAKKTEEDEDEEEQEEEEQEEKPKRRAPAKAAEKKGKAPAKRRATKKKEEESGEDFGDEIAAVNGDDDEDEEDEIAEEDTGKKRKRAPASKAKSSASKPPPKKTEKPVSKSATKSASKSASKPAPKAASKPVSRRKQTVEGSDDA